MRIEVGVSIELSPALNLIIALKTSKIFLTDVLNTLLSYGKHTHIDHQSKLQWDLVTIPSSPFM